MARTSHTAEFKKKVALEASREDKTLAGVYDLFRQIDVNLLTQKRLQFLAQKLQAIVSQNLASIPPN